MCVLLTLPLRTRRFNTFSTEYSSSAASAFDIFYGWILNGLANKCITNQMWSWLEFNSIPAERKKSTTTKHTHTINKLVWQFHKISQKKREKKKTRTRLELWDLSNCCGEFSKQNRNYLNCLPLWLRINWKNIGVLCSFVRWNWIRFLRKPKKKLKLSKDSRDRVLHYWATHREQRRMPNAAPLKKRIQPLLT